MASETLHALRPASTPPSEIALKRLSLGLSQEQLAEVLGVSRPTFSRIENGRLWPDPSQMRAIAKVLGLEFMEAVGLLISAWEAANPTQLQEVA